MKTAAYYDRIYRSGKYTPDGELLRFVQHLCKGKVLDLGCGDARLSMGYQQGYMGVDFSQEAIEIARDKRPTPLGHHVLDFLKEPLPEGPWDTVVLSEVLEHLGAKAEKTLLKKVAGVLRPGGHVVVTAPKGNAIKDPSHVRVFENGTLAKAVQSLGETCEHDYLNRYSVVTAHPGGRPKLSVALIVKNEEELLWKCLESLKGVGDELVVVDTGSTDKTVEIARRYGARLGYFPWCDDFAAARNYAEALCCGEYIYWQDADEVLLEGKQVIRQIVEDGKRDGIAPFLVYNRDPKTQKPLSSYDRQELLHKNTPEWRWEGAAHNWLNGPCHSPERGIVVEHLMRPSGDRPNHHDIFEALRSNFRKKGPVERSIFYLAREHYYNRHYHECLGLVALLLQGYPSWPAQRARACVIAGDCWRALGDQEQAAQAYHKSIAEYEKTGDGYFALGRLRYEQRRWAEAAAWLKACSTFEPGPFFTDHSIYEWRRWDLLALASYRLGRKDEARLYGAKALAARPNDERLTKNMAYYMEAK